MGDLQQLAEAIGADERTLRRAVNAGAVRCRRPTPRRLRVDPEERSYLRSHWRVLAELRELLRTEPNVRFAALYGSVARGEEDEASDVDLVVQFARRDRRARMRLLRKLEDRLGREAQIVHLADARAAPLLLAEILRDGRVTVDRDGLWPKLVRGRRRIERAAEAASEEQRASARRALDELIE